MGPTPPSKDNSRRTTVESCRRSDVNCCIISYQSGWLDISVLLPKEWVMVLIDKYCLCVLFDHSTSMARTCFSFNSCCRSPLHIRCRVMTRLQSFRMLICSSFLLYNWSLCKEPALRSIFFCFLFRFKAQGKGKHSDTSIMPLRWGTRYCFCGTIKTWGPRLCSLINQIMVPWALLEILLTCFTCLPWTQLSALAALVAASILLV